MARPIHLLLPLALAALAAPAAAQRADIPYRNVDRVVHSGIHAGAGDEVRVAFETTVRVPDALWLRLLFSDFDLGNDSFVYLLSRSDGGYQVLDARSMTEWSRGSAIFNGEVVTLQLHVAPRDRGVYVRLAEVLAGLPPGPQQESLCGGDGRGVSVDDRVGRLFLGGCTAWRISNGAFLTAGHCVDFDPDACGAQLPDGTLDLTGVVEFDIPASLANGTTVAAHPDDQYPIDTNSVVWRFDGECQGLGKDWAVFAVFPNANTGLLPHEAYGLPLRGTREAPAASATTRITGCGADSTPPGSQGAGNAQNYTNQTATGPYLAEITNGADIRHDYQVDTTGGSSGSPILWESNGLAIGVHTNGGCGSSTGNSGTSFEVNALETALANFTGTTPRFVDVGHPLPVAEDGSVFRPYDTVAEAVGAVPAGGVVSIVAGSYTASAGNTFSTGKGMTLVAPVGPAVIGN